MTIGFGFTILKLKASTLILLMGSMSTTKKRVEENPAATSKMWPFIRQSVLVLMVVPKCCSKSLIILLPGELSHRQLVKTGLLARILILFLLDYHFSLRPP